MYQINECESILSSSLHGIICEDTYGIPVAWIKLSDQILGDDFKYNALSLHKLSNDKIETLVRQNWRHKNDSGDSGHFGDCAGL